MKELFNKIIEEAWQSNNEEFAFALAGVSGLQIHPKDRFDEFEDKYNSLVFSGMTIRDKILAYSRLFQDRLFLHTICTFMKLRARGSKYVIEPFKKNSSIKEKLEIIKKQSVYDEEKRLYELLESNYLEEIIKIAPKEVEDFILPKDFCEYQNREQDLDCALNLIGDFILSIKEMRVEICKGERMIYLADFAHLELVVDKNERFIGFRTHDISGKMACFIRHEDGSVEMKGLAFSEFGTIFYMFS